MILPFTASASHIGGSFAVGDAAGLAITADQVPAGYVPASATEILLQLWDATNGPSGLLLSEFSADGRVALSGSYEV